MKWKQFECDLLCTSHNQAKLQIQSKKTIYILQIAFGFFLRVSLRSWLCNSTQLRSIVFREWLQTTRIFHSLQATSSESTTKIPKYSSNQSTFDVECCSKLLFKRRKKKSKLQQSSTEMVMKCYKVTLVIYEKLMQHKSMRAEKKVK